MYKSQVQTFAVDEKVAWKAFHDQVGSIIEGREADDDLADATGGVQV